MSDECERPSKIRKVVPNSKSSCLQCIENSYFWKSYETIHLLPIEFNPIYQRRQKNQVPPKTPAPEDANKEFIFP